MKRLIAAALLAPLALTSACTSSSKHKTSTTSSSSTTSAGAQQLATKLHASLATLTSTAISIDAGGLIAPTTGHIKLDNGKATAADLTIGAGTDATHVIIVGSKTYAQLPAGQNTSGKPYIAVTATSKNEFVRGLAGTLDILQAAASLGDIADIVGTATSFTDKGSTTVGGATATDYSFSVTGKSDGSALQQQLADLGTKPTPVDLNVDSQGRPVKVSLGINFGGSTLTINATLSDFNTPVTITAPAANEVASG